MTHSEPQYLYEYHTITVDGSKATASLTECVWFYYEGMSDETFIETEYEVELLKIDEQWLITNVTDNTWFDDIYKGTEFSASEAIFERNHSIETYTTSTEKVKSRAPARPNANTLDYNHESAAAYAFTYTRDSDKTYLPTYYNDMFPEYTSLGGDCMNFASQCVWAGFSADQSITSIDNLRFPMDNSGSSDAYKWYSHSRSTGGKTGSWSGTISFPNYIIKSNSSANQIGLKADYITLGSNEDFSTLTSMGYTLNDIKGSVCVLDFDYDNDGDHAIILTNVTGTARKNILYCGHTQNVKAANLGDIPPCPMAVIIPKYFYTGASTVNEGKYTMPRPLAKNSKAYLECSYGAVQSDITISICSPSGRLTEQVFYRTASCKYTYTPTEVGYYTVCYASPAGAKHCKFYVY